MTTPDIGKARSDFAGAQAALSQAQAASEAVAKAEADERTARSVEWAWSFVASYGQRQAEASAKATALLPAITDAITLDLTAAARLYLDCVHEMATANALGLDLVKARSILKAAGELPGVSRTGRDPVADNAPFPLYHGLIRFPAFLEFVSETLDKQRAMASRVQSGEAPDTYQGKASAALKEDVLRREWVLAAEFEALLAVRETMPARFAQLPPEEQAAVNAYARTREAAGRVDDPLPKIAV